MPPRVRWVTTAVPTTSSPNSMSASAVTSVHPVDGSSSGGPSTVRAISSPSWSNSRTRKSGETATCSNPVLAAVSQSPARWYCTAKYSATSAARSWTPRSI